MTEPTGLKSQRYELLGVIGSGGQGVVHRAFDHWTGRPVAIKVLGSQAARQPQAAERLSREQQALSALKGTAVVEVLDIFRSKDGELCLVMELLKGTTLDEFLQEIEARDERMALPRVAEVFDPIVETLEVAHKAGILHRDLKPANVFLLEGGGVRLLDFGMTRLRTSRPLTAEGTVMGSPSFIAPEAWKGQPGAVDHRADVYSLGVILFRVLAGALPFTGQSLYEKMLGSTKGERPSLHAKRPDLPRDVDEWVQLALAIDREQRFQNVRALWNAFLVTFDVEPPERGKRSSLWAKATEKAKRLVGIADSARSANPPGADALPPSRPEASFITQALRQSLSAAPPDVAFPAGPASSDDETVELPRNAVEATVELGEDAFEPAPPSFQPVEKTLELSDSELVPDEASAETASGEKTLPAGTRVEATPVAPEPSSTKKRGGKKRRKRGKGRKRRR